MLYIFEEEDLLQFAEILLYNAIEAFGSWNNCGFANDKDILEEAKNWATISK